MSTVTDRVSPACRACGGPTQSGTVNLAVWQDNRLVAIRDVPAFVCEVCQEQSFDSSTQEAIANLSARGFPRSESWEEIVVQVFRLPPER
jgi:YgiT-type zinc finger domain-containing protein